MAAGAQGHCKHGGYGSDSRSGKLNILYILTLVTTQSAALSSAIHTAMLREIGELGGNGSILMGIECLNTR